ncbi:MAG TPA: tryptophan synthase subunit alpha, partial [Candidatus Limnocylindria bacterium]
AVGFGISTPEHVASLRGVADAVVVGSAALDAVSAALVDRRPEALRAFVSSLAAAGRA